MEAEGVLDFLVRLAAKKPRNLLVRAAFGLKEPLREVPVSGIGRPMTGYVFIARYRQVQDALQGAELRCYRAQGLQPLMEYSRFEFAVNLAPPLAAFEVLSRLGAVAPGLALLDPERAVQAVAVAGEQARHLGSRHPFFRPHLMSLYACLGGPRKRARENDTLLAHLHEFLHSRAGRSFEPPDDERLIT